MGKFEENAGKHMLKLEDQISKLANEKRGLDWGHDCDCDFCDREEMPPDETVERAEEIDNQIKEILAMQRKLQDHCNLHGVQVFTAKQKRDKVKTASN